MEHAVDNTTQFKIFARTTPTNMTGEYAFVHEGVNRTQQAIPQNDFYLPVFLTKTSTLYEYVEVFRDPTIYKIERQEINPWYVEFAFFDTVKYNKPTVGSGLTANAVALIKDLKPELSSYTMVNLKNWFDYMGLNEFESNKDASGNTFLDYISRFALNQEEIVSKALYAKIDINK
jgi:hypothetical protein